VGGIAVRLEVPSDDSASANSTPQFASGREINAP